VSPQRRRLNLYFDFFETNVNSALVRDFLRELMRSLRGHIFVLLDNASIHRGDEVKELLRSTRRLHLVPLPSYAPELNPDEGVWSHAKRKLANGRPDTTFELGADLYRHFIDLSGNQILLRGFIKHSGLSLRLP
jgi:putative transposase